MIYDIAQRINKENEKHKIMLGEDKIFTINNSAAAVIAIQAEIKKNKNKGEASEEEAITQLYNIIGIGIGKDGVAYIKECDFTIPALNTVVSAITAATINESLEDFEKSAEDNKEEKEPSK